MMDDKTCKYARCGKCATCIDRKAAFEANGLIDPRGYAEETDVKR